MSYMIMDERKDGTGDLFTTFAETRDEAIKEADYQWNVLTSREKSQRRITVIEGKADALTQYDGNEVFDFDGDVIYACE